MPAQYIQQSIESISSKIKNNVVILNLAKWIDIHNNKTISQLLDISLSGINYNYAVLSWWMIAAEVVEWKQLWADLGINNYEIGNIIKWYLMNDKFQVELRKDILNIELYWSLKNIMAIIVWIEEWKGNNASTVWFRLTKFYSEMKEIIWEYGWNTEIDFWYYSLWWDIVATCFGWSRNRYLWKLIWSWIEPLIAVQKLKDEKKHAEGYETLKAVYEKIKDKEGFYIIKELYNKLY
jgi:glycerol-3-phosphate dehydrogenase